MRTQATTNQGDNVGGCDNVISFSDFVACMAKREERYATSRPANNAEGSVIYIGDLR